MESVSPQQTPILQKPPGYRDPTTAQLPPKPRPPRKPPLPPSFRPKPKRRSCCRICCCTCCVILIILILVTVIAGGLFYLFYEPSLPEFHLGSFRVTKLNITEKTDEGTFLNAESATRVEVKNRNSKMVWRFEQSRFQISALDGDLNLGSTTVAAFTVKEKEVTQLKAGTRVKDRALSEGQRRKVKGGIESKALIPSVEVRTKTGVGLKGWNSASISIKVLCGGVTIRQLENGDMPVCSVTVLKWIKIR